MSKISKIIICCFSLIICLCSFVVPTFCITPYDFTYESWENLNNNFYNPSNTSYIKYTNLSINPRLVDSYYIVVNGSFNNSVNLPYSWYDRLTVYGSKLNNDQFSKLSLDLEFKIEGSPTGSQFNVSIISHNESYNDWYIDFSDVRLYTFQTFYFPYALTSMFDNITGYRILGYFDYTFDIEYNNQYFYNQMFGLNLIMSTNYLSSNRFDISFIDNFENEFLYSTTISYYYDTIIKNQDTYSPKKVLLLNNRFSYENSYINRVSIQTFGSWSWCEMLNETSYPNNRFELNTLVYGNDLSYSNFIYSSFYSDDEYSALIPNGSNDYYKTAEWWDIPAHLYNFLIYMIFDAPIISNLTNLIMVLINFIVEVFEFFIGLFVGIENIFFISIFIGIIVLIFLLKIIFKG